MPRDQLLDELFKAFQERERWSIKALRERTQQPEAYLKEVLSEIAFLHRSGEFNGNWELMANYKGEGVRGNPQRTEVGVIMMRCPRSRPRMFLDQVVSRPKISRWRARTRKLTTMTMTMTWRRSHDASMPRFGRLYSSYGLRLRARIGFVYFYVAYFLLYNIQSLMIMNTVARTPC